MKKDLIFAPIMLAVGVTLALLRFTGIAVHIAISVLGILVLAVYTAATKKEWKVPAFEIIMRAFYGIALVTGGVIMKAQNILAIEMLHRVSAGLFCVLLVVLFVYKLITKKKTNKQT